MSTIAVTLIKVLFLALLWIFVLSTAGIIKTDLFGRSVASRDLPQESEQRPRTKRRRGGPRHFIIINGPQKGVAADLGTGYVQIGRSADCQIILDDDYVSTRHAELVADDHGGWYINDKGSTNGTYVNGERISQPTTVTTSDTVRIGRTQLKLES